MAEDQLFFNRGEKTNKNMETTGLNKDNDGRMTKIQFTIYKKMVDPRQRVQLSGHRKKLLLDFLLPLFLWIWNISLIILLTIFLFKH